MLTQPIIQVDAFTDVPYKGNPAGVCVLNAPAPEAWMRNVAAEMNLSETAFLYPDGENYKLRWFTPAVEVELCGHATLASAHVLWEDNHVPLDRTICFTTRSGVLKATLVDGWIELDFPAKPASPAEPPKGLVEALGVQPVYVGRSAFDYLVEVASEGVVRSITPNFDLLRRLAVRGVIVTAKSSTENVHFVSRFFAPAVGVPEDPVTGSAHCTLGPYWQNKLHQSEFVAYQASRRGGIVKLRVAGDRVLLAGKAVTVLRGQLAGQQTVQ